MDLPRDPHDALTLENDIIGVRVWGPPGQPTLSIGKSDLWDRRWFGDRNPLVTMQRIKECAMTGRLGEIIFQDNNHTIYDVYNRFATPCPKPGVQLILGTPFGERVQAEELEDGIQLTVEGREKRLCARIWVHLARPLVVLEISSNDLGEGDFWARVYRHRDTILPGGKEELPRIGTHAIPDDEEQLPLPKCLQGNDAGLVQDLGRELTFPDGFSFAAACRIIGADHEVKNVEGETNLGTPYYSEKEGRIDHGIIKCYSPINRAPGSSSTANFGYIPRSFAMIVTLVTSQDGEEPFLVAREVLDQATALGIDGLNEEQCKERRTALRSNRALARVGKQEVAAPGFVLPKMRIEGGYYGDIPLCSVNTTKFCFQDAALWHADFHLNEIRAEPMLTLGQFEELLPYCEMIATLLPSAIENARDVYSLPGAMYPLVHFPFRYRGVAHTNLTWEQDLGLNGLVAKPLWLYYRYTGDLGYLENLAYPVLRECSRFIDAYLEEGDDDLLHIIPTVSPEHWGITPNFERNRDCTSALSLSKYLLNAAASAAQILGKDAKEARGWISSAQRMAPYPVYQTEKGPVWVDVEGAPPIEYNIPVPLTPVMWGDDVGLDSEPWVLEMAKRTLDQIRIWKPHSGYLDGCIHPRLGIYRPGARIGPENLLLSYQSIHIFPAVPINVGITMENFRAEGGFGISATRTPGNEVKDVRIHSNLGGLCRLTNPWPGRGVKVNGSRDEREVAGSIIEFETETGENLEIFPGNS